MLWFHHILLILLECVELFVLLLLHTAPLNSDSYGLGCFFLKMGIQPFKPPHFMSTRGGEAGSLLDCDTQQLQTSVTL